MHRRIKQRKPRFCQGCGKDISLLPNRAVRCEYCRKQYNQVYINKWKRDHRLKITPIYRGCSRCGKNISDLHYLAEICTDCRDWNKKRVDRDYYWAHKGEMNSKATAYYQNNKESILEYYKKQRRYRRCRDNMIEVVVAVTCVICGDIVIGNGGRRLCHCCKTKWERTIPLYVYETITQWASFEQMPKDILAWKRIMDFRKEGYSLPAVTE